jgi:hypothetical protein
MVRVNRVGLGFVPDQPPNRLDHVSTGVWLSSPDARSDSERID